MQDYAITACLIALLIAVNATSGARHHAENHMYAARLCGLTVQVRNAVNGDR